MPDREVQTAKLKSNFYRDNYRRVIAILIIFLMANVLLVIGLVYVALRPQQTNYYATMNDGSVMQMYPLSEPNLPQSAILEWGNQAAIAAYTLDFRNYVKQFTAVRPYFSDEGWEAFRAGVKKNVIPKLTENQLRATAVARQPPILLEQGSLNGRYTWRVEIPMLVSYQGASGEPQKQNMSVRMTIVRMKEYMNPRGIGIVQFYAVRT